MYNVADDMSSPFTVSGITGSHDDVVNGPNTQAAMSANTNGVPRFFPGEPVTIPRIVSPRLTPSDTPPDTRGGFGIQPPTFANPAPGDLSPIGSNPNPPMPDSPETPDPDAPGEDKPSDPINRLIDLIATQMAGGMAGGTVALPTTTTTDTGSGANALILIVIVGVLGYFGWKHFHKKAA